MQDAWNRISGAVVSLGLKSADGTPWTLPALDARSSKPYGTGGRAVRLIGHLVYFNQNGAFRVSEILDRMVPVFEKQAADGSAFQEVPDYRMPL